MAVTDNATNIVKAMRDLFGENNHFGCFPHTLNLVAHECFAVKKNTDGTTTENVPGLNYLVCMVRALATASKSSSTLANEIRRAQFADGNTEGTAKRLKHDCPTRWNSVLDMIDSFLGMYKIVRLALLNVTHSPPMPNASQLESLKHIKDLLAPLYQATVDISGQHHPTFSRVIPLINLLTKGIEKVDIGRTDPVSKMLKEFLLKSLDKRFKMYEYKRSLAVATIVDPPFKCIHFQHIDACANVITYLKNAVSDSIQKRREGEDEAYGNTSVGPVAGLSHNGNNIWELHDELAATATSRHDAQILDREGLPDELRRYLGQKVSSRHACPFAVWKTLKTDFPNLHTISMRYLPLLASSVPTERMFSQAGIIMTDKRNRLTGTQLNQLLFLSSLSAEQWAKSSLVPVPQNT